MSALAPLATELVRRSDPPLCAISGSMHCSKRNLADYLVRGDEQQNIREPCKSLRPTTALNKS